MGAPKVISEAQRSHYQDHGYLVMDRFISVPALTAPPSLPLPHCPLTGSLACRQRGWSDSTR